MFNVIIEDVVVITKKVEWLISTQILIASIIINILIDDVIIMANRVECLITSTNSASSANICWYNATHDEYARDAQCQLNPEHRGKEWHRILPTLKLNVPLQLVLKKTFYKAIFSTDCKTQWVALASSSATLFLDWTSTLLLSLNTFTFYAH